MIQDDLIVRLGRSQQNLMSMTVQCRRLEIAEQRARERADILEELVMDIAGDLYEGVSASKIDQRIGDVMKKLDEEQPDD